MHKTNKKVAVYGDLTALYSARASFNKNINYNLLDLAIKKYSNVTNLACKNWYTLFHPENESQVDFVKMLEANFGWNVITKRPSEIRRTNSTSPNTDYRFDVPIAYNIGEATSEYDEIVVISDSIELLQPLKLATEFVKVTLSFFNDAMDRRWWRPLQQTKINFVDLSDLIYSNKVSPVQDSERFE